MPKQSRSDLIQHLRTQVGYLRKSGREFDAGDVSEAARLAVTVRVLVYNGRSDSLLKQLGLQHQMTFLDTRARPVKAPGAIVLDSGLGIIRLGDDGAAYQAPLDDRSENTYGRQPFRQWWKRPILKDLGGEWFTRQELVLFLAQKVGGAHVDPVIQRRFHALTKLNSLGWGWRREGEQISLSIPAGPDDEPLGSPIPVNVRQITHEVERTILDHSRDLLGEMAS